LPILRFLVRGPNRWKFCIALFLPLLFVLLFRPFLHSAVVFSLSLIGIFLALSSISLLMAPMHVYSTSSRASGSDENGLPPVPKTLAQLRLMMNADQFEIFSAALVIARGEGHRFYMHSGKAGDGGIDARLHNIHDNIVAIQSKFYAHDNHVEPTDVRDFIGAVTVSSAVYGFFVTTSTFTKAAQLTAHGSRGRVRTIDGHQIEVLLQRKHREVALAYRDVLKETPDKD